MLRISSAIKLKSVFHDFFAAEFATWKIIENQLAVFFEQFLSIGNASGITLL